MDTTELQARLPQLTQLLPSQREWLERLLFQLAFNQHQSVRVIGADGSGKSMLALATAELFSEQYNVALLDSRTAEADVAAHLMQQWFSLGPEPGLSLAEQVSAATSVLPLLLIVDDADNFSAALLQQLHQLPCLLFCFAKDDTQEDDLSLVLNRLTAADAEQLLQHQQLNELDIARRLAEANGNMHVLLQPPPPDNAAAMAADDGAGWKRHIPLIAIAAVVIVALLFWLYAGTKDNTAEAQAVRTQTAAPVSAAVEPPAAPVQLTEAVAPPDEAIQLVADAAEEAVITPPDSTPVASSDIHQPEAAPATEEPAAIDDAPVAEYQYDEAVLLQMDRQAYAVQLAVLSSDAAYQRFKLTYPAVPVLVYQRSWQGRSQLVLLVAAFTDKTDAKAQLSKLPEALRATGPFIKALQAIQTEINVRQSDIAAAVE